jgi:flagellar hook protein FlgE
MIGKVIFKGMPLEDSTIAISNTTQLNKLIGITNGYLELSYVKINKFITKLIIADNQFTVNYALADTMIIPKAGELNDDTEWNIEAPLDNESINAIVRAKSALAESETVVIKPHENADGEFQIEMQFGGNVEHANKVSFYIPQAESNNIPDDFKEHYNSNMIKEIMYCNKDMAGGTIKINLDGIMELAFENENIKSIYYVVSKEI